jgi:hypothetical protein
MADDEPETVKTASAYESLDTDEEPAAAAEIPEADNAYRHGLLDPNRLPEGLQWGNGTNSLDVVDRPRFQVTEAGNIERIDILTGGRKHFTFIPNTEGGWKLSAAEGDDAAAEAVYNRQDSAYRMSIAYARGCGSEDYCPTGYVEGQFQEYLDSMLEVTKRPFTHVWARSD